MGLFEKKSELHIWSKKEINIEALKEVMEGRTSSYQSGIFKKISKKYLKYNKRGVSNLYLIKELDDEGIICATYVFSIVNETIDEERLISIRDAAMKNLGVGEMRAASFAQAPNEWWEQNTEGAIKRVEKGAPDGFQDLLIAELASEGIVFANRQVKNAKLASELECSAVVWGIKESGLRKGIKSRIIQNRYL